MATIGKKFLDLIEIEKGKLDGGVAPILNLLAETNSFLLDAIATPANNGTSHKSTNISGIPIPDWGKLYKGVANKRITRSQIQDTTGFFEARSEVDTRLAMIEPNLAAFRLQEAQGIIEGMAQEGERALFFEDEAINPERMTGLAPRFNKLTGQPQSSQIINAGGVGSDNTSIWFVQHGMNAVHLIYPEGSASGLIREDHGKQQVLDASSNPYFAFVETFLLNLGLVVRDFRKVVRIANIDVSDLKAGTVDLFDLMIDAHAQWKGARRADHGASSLGGTGDGGFEMGRGAIYMNSTVLAALEKRAIKDTAISNLKSIELEGREVLTYRGFPIRQTDQLINTEAALT